MAGLLLREDAETIRCSEENIAPFTLPQEAISYAPPAAEVFSNFKNGDRERKIHNNIELEPEELAHVRALEEVAREQQASFSPTVAAWATRFISRARGDPRKALKLMQATQEWRDDFFREGPIVDSTIAEDMSHGIVYFCGRDASLRPFLVIRANRIPDKWYKEKSTDKMTRVLIFCIEYFIRYMVVPGRVENLNVIVDLQGLGISQVPVGAISEIGKLMSSHYLGRVFKFYIVNLSYILSSLAGIAKSLMTDRQRQKLFFLDKAQHVAKDAAATQLEEDFGGSVPKLQKFFPFPLRPGPFEAGCTTADSSAVKGVHGLLTRRGAQGRIWSESLSREENVSLEYTDEAPEILQKCGLRLPKPVSQATVDQDRGSGGAPSISTATPGNAGFDSSPASLADTTDVSQASPKAYMQDSMIDDDMVESRQVDDTPETAQQEQGSLIQDESIGQSGGFFSCRPCFMSSAGR
eukprot:TRINITY_DN4106_c0_g5_i1.p1 TRINITY_DN4106_c0_g5~~TRINITY_DN4106_c0_g5_i1.p1  ORF type:complete len:499 (+),score=83.05 TRINITY_DN4106_c0_g5_i1:100-1497(+)